MPRKKKTQIGVPNKVVRKKKPATPKKLERPEIIQAEKKSIALMRELKKPETWLTVKKVTNKDQAAALSSVVTWCKDHLKEIDGERKSIVGDLDKAVRKINKHFRSVRGPTEAIMRHCSGILSQYDYKQRQLAERKVEKEAEKAEEAGDEQFAQDLRDNAIRTKPDIPLDGVKAVDRWSAEVEDLDAALVAYIEGNSHLKSMEADLKTLVAKYASKVARATKSVDIGIPGCKGVRRTDYDRHGE